MKIFLTGLLAVTFVSILYVNQHVGLVECSYSINSHEKYLTLLVDRNQHLRYNISKLEAPGRLEEAIKNEDRNSYMMASDFYKINVKQQVNLPSEHIVPGSVITNAGRAFLSMFALGTEAIADESVR